MEKWSHVSKRHRAHFLKQLLEPHTVKLYEVKTDVVEVQRRGGLILLTR